MHLVFDESLFLDMISPFGHIKGREAYKSIFGPFARVLPVIDFVTHEIWESEAEQKVLALFTPTTVFLSDYNGTKAERQMVAIEEVHILKFERDLIVSNMVSGTNFPFDYLM